MQTENSRVATTLDSSQVCFQHAQWTPHNTRRLKEQLLIKGSKCILHWKYDTTAHRH